LCADEFPIIDEQLLENGLFDRVYVAGQPIDRFKRLLMPPSDTERGGFERIVRMKWTTVALSGASESLHRLSLRRAFGSTLAAGWSLRRRDTP
jgi:hypothetical protein